MILGLFESLWNFHKYGLSSTRYPNLISYMLFYDAKDE